MITMAHVTIATHDKHAKIGVGSAVTGHGSQVATEIVRQPKLGKGI